MSDLFVLLGASVTAMLTGVQSPGHILAEQMGAPVAIYAHSGTKLEKVMPPDAVIENAAMVVAIDGLYWYGSTKPEADDAIAAADKLMRLRAGKPLIIGTIPWAKGESVRVNQHLAKRCTGACILEILDGELTPPGLHPDRAYMEKVVADIRWRNAYRYAISAE